MVERRWIVLRHAPAAPRDFARWPDDHGRPLNLEGRKQFRQAARGLRGILEHDGQIASSPLKRAEETTSLLHAAWPAARMLGIWPELRPDAGIGELFTRARGVRGTGDLVLVGHEPELSRFVGFCLTGQPTSVLKLARGGAVAIDFPGSTRPGSGRLLWVLTRSQLRKLGRSSSDDDQE
jgi:phosphohistidine phosphatase